ncbi:ABC transporter permease subunit [Tissierellaceae bacterium BX21]|uniref:ABC transporter permease subunit n=2 Tax=Paratissierella segnis TaxID=2763679 RepID=A0A926IJU4_9FIRM|nr:ABC transporter permease subunit [Paratissierella segnis]
MRSSISNKRDLIKKIYASLFWIILWYLISNIMNNKLLLPSPIDVFISLVNLLNTKDIYISIANTFIRIITGFFLGSILGIILSIFSYKFIFFKSLMEPLILMIKATPIASIIILALVWISSKNLSVFIAFLMVLPTMYTTILKGLDSTDEKMLEMAKVFKIKGCKLIRYIYMPSIKPYLIAAASLALGLSWKAGVAAEVIGLPSGTIGESLYTAKIYLNTPELFAWTFLIVAISFIFEKLFIFLLNRI